MRTEEDKQTCRAGGFVWALAALISIGGHAGCAAAKPIANNFASFDVRKGEDDVDINLAIIPTKFQGRDGKPVMASPRDVLVIDPRQTARIFSVDDKGHLRIRRALPGRYVVYMAEVEKLSASASSVVEGQDVVFTLTTRHFPDGTPVEYQVREESAMSWGSPPESALATTVRSDQATFHWSYKQPLGSSPGGEYVATAWVRATSMTAAPIQVRPFPLTDLRGIEQLLLAKGYDNGGVRSVVLDPATQRALTAFQTDRPPCAFGITGETENYPCGVDLCAAGGLAEYPAAERGNLGPMTRRALACTVNPESPPQL
jgi:hypothetical protein